jgi:lipopolysaccharide transport system ATP-binding protein
VHHPTGYWLTPALLALQHDVPLVWNGPGMHLNEIPSWAEPLMRLAVALSARVAVRDEPTRAAFARFAGAAPVVVIPDTAFAIAGLLGGRLAEECAQVRAAAGVSEPYVLLHASRGLERFARVLADQADRLSFRVLAVPIGPVLGNRVEDLGADIPGLVRLASWPHPLLLAELIREAEAVIGYSYHLAITAVANGVPVFTPAPLTAGKFSALAAFDTIHAPPDGPLDAAWLTARVGKQPPSAAARATLGPVARHWDAVAEIVAGGPRRTSAALDRYWQAWPGVLETMAAQLDEARGRADAERARADGVERARDHDAERGRREVAELERRLRALEATLSWRVTSPLRRARDAVLGKKHRAE